MTDALSALSGTGGALLENLHGSATSVFASVLRQHRPGPLIVVVPDLEAADEAEEDLHTLGETQVFPFPAWDVLPSETDHLELETLRDRILALRRLADRDGGPAPCLVTTATALMQPTVSPDALNVGELAVARGAETAPEALCARLADSGFEPVATVEAPGQFARRGGIVDVFPFFASEPVRIDFFGDEVDSVFAFDVVSQRSGDAVERAVLVDLSTSTIAAAYRGGAPACTLADHLPEGAVLLVFHPDRCAEIGRLYEEGLDPAGSPVLPYAEAAKRFSRFARGLVSALAGEDWPDAWGAADAPPRIDFATRTMTRLEGSTAHALDEVRRLVEAGETVHIACHNEASRTRCREVLLEAGGDLANRVDLALGRISHGFAWPAAHWAVAGDHELFHRYRHKRRVRKRVAPGAPIRDFTELRPGDYVVHVLHGIARFTGMVRLEQNGQENDFLTLRFAEKADLYVPLSHIDLVQKYIGGGEARPQLSKLGGKTWSRKKARAEKAVREVAADLLRLQAVRQASPGFPAPPDTEWLRRFEDEFPYEETDDQLSAMAEIKTDMEAASPMDRILCGDVGFGKTELAVRAAFKIVTAGRQVGVLVPTTILAEQHFRTFSERMADYPVRVERLSRFRTPAEQRRIVDATKAGAVDVLIGTHRLLSQDVAFRDLGLAIIDEEQRFGVEHKERLKELRASVDVLTLTATPIPRTLHMGLLGLRDISTLATAPQDRQAITTQVVRSRPEILRRAILRELARGGQVYFVHNRVQNIENVAMQVAEACPEARIGIAHGQMPAHDLEEVMVRFLDQKIDVLVATTIIESGLDIPNVNTLFVNDADHFGLSQLHQLRGRVGRYRSRAYAYFLIPPHRPPSPVGQKRLRAIEEFAHLGAGFHIAMRDLEIRGAGNILGLEQSGHIHEIGYDLYCRLLARVVNDLKGEPTAELPPVELELGRDAYLPEAYVALEPDRLRIYRDLAECAGFEDLEALVASLRDRYGPPPEPVGQLVADTRLRIRARAQGIEYIGRLDRALAVGITEDARNDVVARMRASRRRGGRAFTSLSGGRFRFGLAPDEAPWETLHEDLVDELLDALEGRDPEPPAPPSDDDPASHSGSGLPSWV
ncbi:MAG: transcription-repair coupling factor [Planctomycetota bacterium]